ncbi:MAG: hypothetical protein JSS66_13145 [Armatimonadetes bacterium]|nr:hypothetical protein [Armatimonadota bacterium]
MLLRIERRELNSKATSVIVLWLIAAGASAQYTLMDHINGTRKSDIAVLSQVFGDFPTFSSSAVDDYTGGGRIILAQAEMALFNSPYTTFSQWDAGGRLYRLSTYASLTDVRDNVAADRIDVTANSFIQDPQGFGPWTARVTFDGLSLAAPLNGWFGVQGIGDYGSSGEIGVLGAGYGYGGLTNNAYFVNPGGGFGLFNNMQSFSDIGALPNAKYLLVAVPEPSLVGTALLVGLLAGASRNRRGEKGAELI